MINKDKFQLSIQSLISILILMTLFVISAHATSCHNLVQEPSQSNQNLINEHKASSATIINVAEVPAEAGVIKKCCIGICKAFCNPHSFTNNSLLASRSFEKKHGATILKTNHYFDSELEYTYKKLKSQNYYRSNHPAPPPLLQTALKHRVLHI
jgi:hypothetical protein